MTYRNIVGIYFLFCYLAFPQAQDQKYFAFFHDSTVGIADSEDREIEASNYAWESYAAAVYKTLFTPNINSILIRQHIKFTFQKSSGMKLILNK